MDKMEKFVKTAVECYRKLEANEVSKAYKEAVD